MRDPMGTVIAPGCRVGLPVSNDNGEGVNYDR